MTRPEDPPAGATAGAPGSSESPERRAAAEVSRVDRSPRPFSARLAVLLAVVAAGLIGGLSGGPVATVLALAGSLIVGATATALVADDNARRARGSIGLVVGVGAVALALELAAGAAGSPMAAVVVGVVAVAVAFATGDAAVGIDDAVFEAVVDATHRSGVVLGIATVLVAAGYHDAYVSVPSALIGAGIAVAGANELAAFVSLQWLALAVAVLLATVRPILDRWLPDDSEEVEAGLSRIEPFAFDPSDVPREAWAVLGVETLLALTRVGPELFRYFLARTSVFGAALEWVLVVGVVHWPLAAFAALLAGIVAAEVVRATVVAWTDGDPPSAFAFATGGAVTAVVGAVVAALPPVATLLRTAGEPRSTLAWAVGTFGPSATVLAGLTLALLAVLATLLFAGLSADEHGILSTRATGFVLAAAALFAASVGAALADAPAAVVFVGVAASLVVWDLGDNAATMGHQIGTRAGGRQPETVHAAGSLLVAAGAVVLALLALYVVGPVSTASLDRETALLALALVMVALLAFASLIEK